MHTYRVLAYRRQLVECYVVAKDAEHASDEAALADQNSWTVLDTTEADNFEIEMTDSCHKDDPRWYEND
jgi:hypothetical protein